MDGATWLCLVSPQKQTVAVQTTNNASGEGERRSAATDAATGRPQRSAPEADGRAGMTPRTCGAEGGPKVRRRERGRGTTAEIIALCNGRAGRHHGHAARRGGASRQRVVAGIAAPRRWPRGYVSGGKRKYTRPPDETAEISAPHGWPRGDVAADKRRGVGSAARRRRRDRGRPRRSSSHGRRVCCLGGSAGRVGGRLSVQLDCP